MPPASSNNDIEFWKILIPTLIAVLGWGIGYFLSKRKDRQNKRQEIITKHLIDAYKSIETCCGRPDNAVLTPEYAENFRQAIADIQLFGSTNLIRITKHFTQQMNREAYGDPRNILIELRNSLRKELGLPKASDDPNDIIHWYIIEFYQKPKEGHSIYMYETTSRSVIQENSSNSSSV